MKAKLIKVEDDYRLIKVTENGSSIIGTTDLDYQKVWSDVCQKLSFKNCEAISNGYDLDELAEKHFLQKYSWTGINNLPYKEEDVRLIKEDFIAGAITILKILGNKKFSEEDLNKAFELGKYVEREDCTENYLSYKQSLQPKEWDVEVEMEKVKDEVKTIGVMKGVKGGGHKITTYKSVPKLDKDGYLILKRKS